MSDIIYYNIEYTINKQQNQQEAQLDATFSGIIYNEGNAIIDIIIYKEQQLGDAIIPGQTLTFSLQPFQYIRVKGVFIAKIKFLFDQENSSSSSSTVKIKGVLTFTQGGAGFIDLEGMYVNTQIINSSSNPVPTEVTNTPSVNVANSSSNPVPITVTNTPLSVVKQPNATVLGSVLNAPVLEYTNIFSSALSISQPSKIKIIVVASASGILKLEITSGTTTVSGTMNSGNALTADAFYEFEIDLPGGVSINLQYSVSTTMTIFVIATPLG
jgi:hypothetical protein